MSYIFPFGNGRHIYTFYGLLLGLRQIHRFENLLKMESDIKTVVVSRPSYLRSAKSQTNNQNTVKNLKKPRHVLLLTFNFQQKIKVYYVSIV